MGFRTHQFGQCLMVGHRGAAGLAPENTLPGFALALAHGVDAVELDVRWVHDALLVIHDSTLDRTTDGRGPLSRTNLTRLRALDAGDGARIPLLDEVLAAVPETVGINIEIKGRACAAPLARCLAAHAPRDLLVSSFTHTELRAFRTLCPEVPVAPLFARWRPNIWKTAAALNAWSVNLAAALATPRRVANAHAKRLRVLCYTVNDPIRAQRLISMGVDGLFTDFPDGRLLADPAG